MKLAAFGVRRPVVANLVMLALIAAGLLFGQGLRREFFPELPTSTISILAAYPGAAPEEVESAVATKIEDAIEGIAGIEDVTTTVREGSASLVVEFEDGVDIDEARNDVDREVDAIQDLPEATDEIIVDTIEQRVPAIIVSLYGDGDPREMKAAIRSIKDDLLSLPGITDIAVDGVRRDEIVVEVHPAALIEHGLSMSAIAQRIRAAMLESPGGSVRTATANYAIRTLGVDERAGAISEIVVQSLPGGRVLTLGDVAEVSDGFADTPLVSRLNGKPAVNATLFVGGDDDVVEVAEMAKAYVAARNGEPFGATWTERLRGLMTRPGDARSSREEAYRLGASRSELILPGELTTTTDLARFVVGRLDLLTRNALLGGVLVFVVLVLLLNWRVSFWVAAGLIVSLAGTLVLMRITGITLNLITMFGLIVVIGILVDDAIVVAENITRRHEEGEPALVAAVRGTGQVGWPVVATVLTTVFAFLPLGIVEGSIGDFLSALPVVVACALLISLVESLFILPCHMGHSLKSVDHRERSHREGFFTKLEHRLDRARDAFIARVVIAGYAKLLGVTLARRYTTLMIALAILIGSLGMIAGGRLEFIFFETDDAETINAELRMPVGTPLSETERVVRRIEAAVAQQPEVTSYFASIGSISPLDGGGTATVATDAGQLIMELAPIERRDRTSEQVIQSIRDALGPTPSVRSLVIRGNGGGPSGAAISYAIVGDDFETLDTAVAEVTQLLGSFDGVVDILTSQEKGLPELQVELRPGATELGFTRESLGRQVQGFAFGIEAFTFAGDREDVDVRVLLPERTRRSLADLENQYVFTPTGVPVPLREVAYLSEARTESSFRRLNRRRVITVEAEVDRRRANPERVNADLRPMVETIVAKYPGVELVVQGRQKDLGESFASLPGGFLLAAGLIYVVLAWLFGSYLQPLIVMSAIPFAAIGMVWGHLLLGYSMTFLSIIGFVALSGVIVNDSLLFMEFFNELRRQGLTVHDAAIRAGRARVRAILLTTVTTVFGLLPLMLEQSFQARFLIPMAITIAFGLMSATGIILVVLPSLLMILSDVKRLVLTLWKGERVTEDLYHDHARELEEAIKLAERRSAGAAANAQSSSMST